MNMEVVKINRIKTIKTGAEELAHQLGFPWYSFEFNQENDQIFVLYRNDHYETGINFPNSKEIISCIFDVVDLCAEIQGRNKLRDKFEELKKNHDLVFGLKIKFKDKE